MGFPKPWPTEWPDPDSPAPEAPTAPERGDPDTPDAPWDLPEFRARFFSATWAITHPCNLRCIHCYDVTAEARHDLGTDDALAVVDRLADSGVRFIAFSGGEPFLRRDVFGLMARARERGMNFGARSNGTRITPAVAARLRELGAGVVGVSFDGASRESHDLVRGAGAFDAAMAGLRALLGAGIRAQMEVVLSRRNVAEADDFIRLGEASGASEVNFSAMTPRGRATSQPDQLLDWRLWTEVTGRIRAASRLARVPVSPNCALLGECVVNFEPHITCDGWMTPCYLSAHRLLRVLDTPPDALVEALRVSRRAHLDGCGRAAWTAAPTTPPARRVALAVVA